MSEKIITWYSVKLQMDLEKPGDEVNWDYWFVGKLQEINHLSMKAKLEVKKIIYHRSDPFDFCVSFSEEKE